MVKITLFWDGCMPSSMDPFCATQVIVRPAPVRANHDAALEEIGRWYLQASAKDRAWIA